MAIPKFAFETLPNWPRLLNQQQAAAYLSVSTGTFVSELRAGIWPAPVQMPRPRRKVWDIKALDVAVDRLSGFSSGAPLEDVGISKDPGYIKRLIEEAYGNEAGAKRKRPRSP